MPELPEVENVRRSLAPRLLGRSVREVVVHRAGVVHGERSPEALLLGQTLTRLDRHGKHLALIGSRAAGPQGSHGTLIESRSLDIHLGMTGSLRHYAGRGPGVQGPDCAPGRDRQSHVHVVWKLDDGSQLEFRDPRRFGGIWTFASFAQLHRIRWQPLGPDALVIAPRQLQARLARTRRPIKAALLDQELVAGLGNIYVDELLFACRVHPLTPTQAINNSTARLMVRAMKPILNRAIRAGGSSVNDYVDGQGRVGSFQKRHKVYGRAGQPCRVCSMELAWLVIAGRMSVFCPQCQPRRQRKARRKLR